MASTEALLNNCNFTNFNKTLLSILFVKYIAPRTLLACRALCSLPMQVCPVSWVVCLLRVSCLFRNLFLLLVLASSSFVNQGAWPDHLLVPLLILLPWFLSSLNLSQSEAREKWAHLGLYALLLEITPLEWNYQVLMQLKNIPLRKTILW